MRETGVSGEYKSLLGKSKIGFFWHFFNHEPHEKAWRGLTPTTHTEGLRFAFITGNCGTYGVRELAPAFKAAASRRTPKLPLSIKNLSEKTRSLRIVARTFARASLSVKATTLKKFRVCSCISWLKKPAPCPFPHKLTTFPAMISSAVRTVVFAGTGQPSPISNSLTFTPRSCSFSTKSLRSWS